MTAIWVYGLSQAKRKYSNVSRFSHCASSTTRAHGSAASSSRRSRSNSLGWRGGSPVSAEQRHQGLTVVARATPDQPALAAGAARAVAAAPQQLLSLAARTVAAELAPEVARPWLLGLQDAITEQAQQPDADLQTSAWAAGVVSASLTHLETGLEDYFNSVDAIPPPPEPGSARHDDDDLEEDVDDPEEAEADWGTDTENEEEPEDEQTADPVDTATLPPLPHRTATSVPASKLSMPTRSPARSHGPS
ncbi:hypothetical protein ABCR94_17030 [Streptomyces sp. 21So2-11]|uniref:hypothetical protein n=1 Tax=Streptomyces sp. 21So2-11 TaxID=3144408 RepID=UPI00321B1003